MRSSALKPCLFFLLTATLSVYSLPGQALPRYAITDLGTLGGSASSANAMNNSAEVVGTSFTRNDADIRPFLYRNGVMSPFEPAGLPASFPLRINDLGQVTGYAPTPEGTSHAFLYRDGLAINLGTLGGSFSQGRGLNNAGDVVGQSGIAGDAAARAFIFNNGSMKDLGTLGGSYGDARDINDAAQVVGQSSIAGEVASRAFLLTNGTMRDLGTLGGTYSAAFGINNAGQVIGVDYTPGDNTVNRAFLYNNNVMVGLGSLGGAATTPGGINDFGQVVGTSNVRPGDFTAPSFMK